MLLRPLITALVLSLPALATDGGSGFTAWFNNVWGDEASRTKLSACEIVDDANIAGFVGYANNLFCHIENELGVKGTTAAGGVTGKFMFAAIPVHVHIEVAGQSGGAAYNGYDFEAKLWGCAEVGGVACTSTAEFHKFAYVTWSYNADKTVSKGVMVHDQYIQNGTTGLYVKTTWDTGTATGTKTLSTLEKNGNYWMLATREIIGTKSAASIVVYDGTNGRRFAAATDSAAGMAGSRLLVQTGSTTDKNDAATLNCFTRTRVGDDYDMSPDNTAGACSTLPTVIFPSVSTADLAAYALSDLTGSSGGWTAMSANPSAL